MITQTSPQRRFQSAGAGLNILVFLSAAICVLCVVQWVVQSKLREMVETERKLKVTAQTRSEELDAQSKRYADEAARIEIQRKELDELVKTNKTEVMRLSSMNHKLEAELSRATNHLALFQEAYEKLTNSGARQNLEVAKQNDLLKKVAEQRDDVIGKYQSLSTLYTDTVNKYNTLVKQVEDERAQLAKQAAEKK
jgi:hypothetical protein